MSDLANPIFTNEAKARQWLEVHVWPDGPVCPHCGVQNFTKLEGEAHRPGLYQCNDCRQQFTVTVGTVMERSKIALTKWLMAVYLLSSSKKGMSTNQIGKMLKLPYKTAWFMTHRIREAMREGKMPGPLGGEGIVVEADETYIGGKVKNKHNHIRGHHGSGTVNKEAAISLVERGGKVRSFHLESVTSKNVRGILRSQLNDRTYLVTDESAMYRGMDQRFAGHSTVNHSAHEYVRHGVVHTNTVENYFSILKRGITGVYHHVSQQHLKRYLAEFDFRYNEREALGVDNLARTVKAIKGISGKRLTYRRTDQAVQR